LEKKHWSLWQAGLFGLTFGAIDLAFVGANLPKIQDGGWFPLVIAGAIFTMLTTWKRGRRILAIRLKERNSHLNDFLEKEVRSQNLIRIPGTAFYMVSDPDITPPALARNLSAHHVLHERAVILSIATLDIPRVDRKDRLNVEILPQQIYRATCHFGFMETPSMEEVLKAFELTGVQINMKDITFYLGRETLLVTEAHHKQGMANWRKVLFAIMSKNAERATQFFNLPPDQVVEIGCQIEL
jgi:KUP system potassium uptake protein